MTSPLYTRRVKTPAFISVHCADTPATLDIGVATIRKWHVEERGWIDVGYHGVIRRSGNYEEGRPLWAIPAAVENHNSAMLAICLVGGRGKTGGPENNFTPAQWVTLKCKLTQWTRAYPGIRVLGHRDFPGVGKYCPSFDASSWWAANKG